MQISSQLRCTDLAQNAQDKSHNVVVITAEIDSDTIRCHHKEFGFLVEQLS